MESGQDRAFTITKRNNKNLLYFVVYLTRYGKTVGSHPCVCIIASCLLVIVCASGLVNFQLEIRRDKLWVPPGSRILDDINRVEHYFPTRHRIETLLIEADNVLDPKVLKTVSGVYY